MKKVISTNDVALKIIKKSTMKSSLITSLIQTKGRGTMGKKWISQKGNLFFTIFFEINQKKINFKQYAELNAYIMKKIIKKFTSEKIDIKWPNDLLINKDKICGILQEVINYNNKTFLIIGVGINTNNSPSIKKFKSTSLKEILGKKINNNKVLTETKKIYENFIIKTKKFSYVTLKNTYIT